MAERDFYIILSPEADVEAVSAAVVAIVSSPAALVKHAGDTLPKFIKRRMIVDERAKSAS